MPPRKRRAPRPGTLSELSPGRIATQIAILQAAYYILGALLILFTSLVAGERLNLDLLFNWHTLRGDITTGWTLALCWLLDSLACVVLLLVLIARSKLVPDFALTIHFIHLVITSFYTHSIPTYLFWWGLQITSATMMTLLGVWSCQWRELQPINFGASESADGTSGNIVQEDAVSRWARKLRNLKGGEGDYELVGRGENSGGHG